MNLPPDVINALWSYDTDALDLERHKKLIIFNVLNYGSDSAVRWLFATYPREACVHVLQNTPQSQWSKKSLNFWSMLFHTAPFQRTRFIGASPL